MYTWINLWKVPIIVWYRCGEGESWVVLWGTMSVLRRFHYQLSESIFQQRINWHCGASHYPLRKCSRFRWVLDLPSKIMPLKFSGLNSLFVVCVILMLIFILFSILIFYILYFDITAWLFANPLHNWYWMVLQHGPDECELNIIQTCAIRLWPKVVSHLSNTLLWLLQ